MQLSRLGSIVNSRARHSATQESCWVLQAAALTQVVQPGDDCAIAGPDDRPPARAKMTKAAFTVT